MSRKRLMRWTTTLSPSVIESVALFSFIAVIIVGIATLFEIPHSEFKRQEVLPVLTVIFGALGVVSVILLWAQLRHEATLSKLLTYHEYFHDLPNPAKVNALCGALVRLNVKVPLWQAPLSPQERNTLVADTEVPPNSAHLAAREYLNDFEEFSAAINAGLVDEDYAYQLEGSRTLNAYYGFKELILHWVAEDRARAEREGEQGAAATNYYSELKSVSERWRNRKIAEARAAAADEDKRRIRDRM
jgi:hypothetical protein